MPLPRKTSTSLIVPGEDLNVLNEKGRTKLMTACEAGEPDKCRLLLLNKAFPDVATSDGMTPLYMACKAESVECAHCLVMCLLQFELGLFMRQSPLCFDMQVHLLLLV